MTRPESNETPRQSPKNPRAGESPEAGNRLSDRGRRPTLAQEETGEMRRPKGDPQRYDKHGGKLDHDGKPAKSEE
jgi:hypothetical protein